MKKLIYFFTCFSVLLILNNSLIRESPNQKLLDIQSNQVYFKEFYMQPTGTWTVPQDTQVTYRNWLQGLANGGDVNASALLNVAGNDGNLNGYFTSGNSNLSGNGFNLTPSQTTDLNNTYNNGFQNFATTNPSLYGGVGDTTSGQPTGGVGGVGGGVDTTAYDKNTADLQDLLGRTDTGLTQGLTQNEDQYNTQVGKQNDAKALQYDNFNTQRINQKGTKQSTQDANNVSAGQGYRSLAQIIGRSAGTGSSAFRDLLPNVVGKDLSGRQKQAANTYGQNMGNIDKSQGQYDISFAGVLADLLKQKKTNEDTLRTNVENQRQGINSQLQSNATAKAQALGKTPAQAIADAQPFQDAINNSRNTVEGFFNTFRTPYTPTQAVATAPDLSQYSTDRAQINAQNQGGNADNPYGALLRKKLTGVA
jgi:hypothetical protein